MIYRTATGTWLAVDASVAGAVDSSAHLVGTAAAASGPLDAFVQVVDRAGNVAVVNL